MKQNEARAASLANLDRMWAGLREHKADIDVIAEFGLPAPDDDGAAEHQDKLIKLMACVVAAELGARELT